MEAEVQCRRCKGRQWVAWAIRHDGHDPRADGHKDARCPNCGTGVDYTDYTGRMRGEVESTSALKGFRI